MKVVLVFYERITADRRQGFGHANYRLALNLHAAGLLDRVICLDRESDLELPADRVTSMFAHAGPRLRHKALARAGRRWPAFDARRRQEALFDRFAASRLRADRETLVLSSRPLFELVGRRARAQGAAYWVLSSIPHPLLNHALVRNEELRLGLPARGSYSDADRTARLARTIALADRVLTLAPGIARYTYDSYAAFLPTGRILPLERYFSVDPAAYEAKPLRTRDPDEGLVFLHLSFVNLIKGIAYLLDAWRIFRARSPRPDRLIIAGRMDENAAKVLQRNRIEGIETPGYVPDLRAQLGAADVFLSPSVSDAGPATILEAMAAGLPVIASRNCGFASLVEDGVQGYTYPYHDAAGLASLMERCAGDPDAAAAMGRKARELVESMSLQGYADELLELVRGHG